MRDDDQRREPPKKPDSTPFGRPVEHVSETAELDDGRFRTGGGPYGRPRDEEPEPGGVDRPDEVEDLRE